MNIDEIINKIYEKLYGKDSDSKHGHGIKYNFIKKGFFKNYGADLFISIIIIYIFAIAIMYFHVLNHIPNIKANWSTEKCNPLYLPFAGLIINDANKSTMNMVSENFVGCVNNILATMSNYAFSPIYFILNTVTLVMALVNEAINSIRAFFNKIRIDIEDIASDVSDRTFNVSIPIMHFFIVIKDTMSKAMGLFTAGMYTLFGQYLILKSLIGSIIEIGIAILIIGLAMIAVAWAIPFTWPLAIAGTVSYGIILTFLIMIMLMGAEIFSLANRSGSWKKMPTH
jgi:hypothetical protein